MTAKARNPLVPVTPDEHAEDAIACIDAGATVIHTHAEHLTAPADEVAEEYARAYRPVARARPGAICYATTGIGPTIEDRYRHVELLADMGLTRAAFVDTGSVNLGGTGPRRAARRTAATCTRTTSPTSRTRCACAPSAGSGRASRCSNPASSASCSRTRRPARCPRGALVKFYFSEGGYLGGGEPLWGVPPIARSARRVPRDARRRADRLGGRGARRFAARRADCACSRSSAAATSASASRTSTAGRRTPSRSPARRSCARRSADRSRRSTKPPRSWTSRRDDSRREQGARAALHRRARAGDVAGAAACFDAERYYSHAWEGDLAVTWEKMKARRRDDTFSDWKSESIVFVADGDRVVHHAPRCRRRTRTGTRADLLTLEIWRIENGLIVEHWGGSRVRAIRNSSLKPCTTVRTVWDRSEPARRSPQSVTGHVMPTAVISSSSRTARRATTTTSSTRYECGIMLLGAEVKSIREGHANLQDGYARVDDGEVWLHGLHVIAVRVLARRRRSIRSASGSCCCTASRSRRSHGRPPRRV